MEYNAHPRFTFRGGDREPQDKPGDARHVYQRYYSSGCFGGKPERGVGADGEPSTRPSRNHCPRT